MWARPLAGRPVGSVVETAVRPTRAEGAVVTVRVWPGALGS